MKRKMYMSDNYQVIALPVSGLACSELRWSEPVWGSHDRLCSFALPHTGRGSVFISPRDVLPEIRCAVL